MITTTLSKTVEVLIRNTHDVVDFDSPGIDIYKNHKIYMIRLRTLQYLVKDLNCSSYSSLKIRMMLLISTLNGYKLTRIMKYI